MKLIVILRRSNLTSSLSNNSFYFCLQKKSIYGIYDHLGNEFKQLRGQTLALLNNKGIRLECHPPPPPPLQKVQQSDLPRAVSAKRRAVFSHAVLA